MATQAVKKTAAPKNRPRTPGSVADRINTLEIGQSVSESQRFTLQGSTAGMLHIPETLIDCLKRLRNTAAVYIARITDDLDARTFRVESGTFLTDDKTAVHCVAIITRMT